MLQNDILPDFECGRSCIKLWDRTITTKTVYLNIYVHLLHHDQTVRIASISVSITAGAQFRNSDISPNLLLGDDLLLQPRGSALGELVVPLLPNPLIRLDVITHHLRRLTLLNNTDIDVGARAEIIEDTRLDGVAADFDGFGAVAVVLPLGFEDGHGGETARAHGYIGEFVGGAVRVHGEEADAGGVDARDDEVGADVALVAEEVLFEHCHDGYDARWAAGGEGVEFEAGGDERGGKFGVSGCAGAGAEDGRGDVVEFFAVLGGE
jgi:hypothetical protein